MIKLLKGIISIIFFFTVILQSIKVNAQKDSITNYKDSYVTLSLLSHANSFSPRWRLGYIKSINKKFKVGLDVGYGNKKVLLTDYQGGIGDNYRLWEVRPEFYYVDEYNTNSSLYLSLDLFYMNHKDVFFNSNYRDENEGQIEYSRADYRRQKYGFNIKYGFIFEISNRIKLNLYSGLGIRIRNNSFTNIVNPRNPTFGDGEESFFKLGFDYIEGNRIGLNFPLGLKLFYKL